MKKYYLYNGFRQYGPFSLAELKHQSIHHNTQVWYEGSNGWVKAGAVEELQPILPAPCAPPAWVNDNSQETSTNALPSRAHSRLQIRFRNRILFIASLIISFLLLIAVLAICLE